MRHSFLLLFFLSSLAFADAYKCKDQGGRVVVMSSPCDFGARVSVAQSDSPDGRSVLRARQDLERQKAFVRDRENQRQSERPVAFSSASADRNDHGSIYACLTRVTSTPGLSPHAQAQRKVSCYSATSGLLYECHSSVAATANLPTRDETAYKSMCPP